MINNGFKKAILIGHISDESADIIKLFYDSGAKLFLKKPSFFKDVEKLAVDSYK